jgi:hypothetical protein
MSRRVRVFIDGKRRWMYQHEIDRQIMAGKMRWSEAAGDVLISIKPPLLTEQKAKEGLRRQYEERVLASAAMHEREKHIAWQIFGLLHVMPDRDGRGEKRPPKRHRKRTSK